MKVQIVDVSPGLNRDGSPDTYVGQGGSRPYFLTAQALEDFPGERIAAGGEVYFKGNFKNAPVPGAVENFKFAMKDDGSGRAKVMGDDHTHPGTKIWRLLVSRDNDNSRAGNPYNGAQNAQRAPQSHANPQGAAQVAAAVQAPTVTEYGQEWASIFPRSHALMTRLAAGIAPPAEDGTRHPDAISPDTVFMAAKDFTTSIMIALQRRDVCRDKTAEEASTAYGKAFKEGYDAGVEKGREDERVARDAAERAKSRIPQATNTPADNAGYTPSEDDRPVGTDDGVIPF